MPFSSESQLRRTENILGSISDCFFALDSEWRFVYLNPQAQQFFAGPAGELLGQILWEALPLFRGTTTEREFRRVRESGGRSNFVVQSFDGRWIEHTIYARDEDAELPEAGGGISVFFRDVTDRRRNAQATRESDEFYRLLVENAREYGIIALDVDGCITHWNEGARRMFGWNEGEVRGQKGDFIFTPQDRENDAPQIEIETARCEGRAQDERWHLKKDGSLCWAEGAMMALGFDDGEVRGFVKILRDNTEKRAAQQAVTQNEERLKRVSDATGIALWTWEPASDRITYQHALDTLLGFSVESLTDFALHAHPDDVAASRERVAQAIATGCGYQAQYRVSAQPGVLPWKWISSIMSVGQTPDGAPLLLGVNTDITRLLSAQHALEESRARLENVVHETGVALWSWNATTDELLEELNLETMTGLSPFSMEAMRAAIHPGDWPCVEQTARNALERGEGYEIEHRLARFQGADVSRPGDWKWLAVKAGTTPGATGETIFSGFVFDISSRRENELALQQSRERLESVVREAGVALWLWKPDGDLLIEHVNLEEMFEVPGQKVDFGLTLRITHPGDREQLRATVEQAVQNSAPYEIEFRLKRRACQGDPQVASDWKWIFITGKPRVEDRSLMSCFAFDISSRKEAELQRRASEERYTALVNASTTMVWRTNAQGHFIDSTRWGEYTGQSPEERAEFGWFNAIDEEDRARVWREWNEAVEQKLPVIVLRYRVRHCSGQVRHVLVRGVPLFDGNGQLSEWLGTLEDVHDQIEAQNAVRESEARYAALVRTSAAVVWRGSPDMNRVETTGWRDYTGAKEERVDNFSWLDFLHPDEHERARDEWNDLLAHPRGAELRQRLRHRSGQFRHVLVRAVPLFDEESGALREWIGTLSDVHERTIADELRELFLEEEQRARQLAEEARVEAERANKMKDEFLAVVSHELRTPLNAILGWSNILQSGELPPETAREGLAVIERNARAQAQIVEDILDVARVVTGKLKVEARPLDLETVAREALEATQTAATQRGVIFRSELVSLPVEGEAIRLRQMLWNLLSNAIKFSPASGHVELTMSRRGNSAHIEVRDEGTGIAPEFLPHVFERFRQADSSSTRRHGGLGLGLALVRSIAEAHNGRVEARSEGLGKGATFVVELPLSEKARQVTVEVAPKTVGRLAGVSILVCDDAPDTLEFTALLLRREGARVALVSSAAQARGKLESDSFDVLLSDLAMPDQDGYELLKWVQTHTPQLPVAAMTAYAGTVETERARDAGFAGFIAKPIEAEVLVQTVASIVKRAG